ncbi:rRNA maturation RNase YbeY [Formosa sp. Hel1_31_208]|uniref:rRNA maturation RNase YbeY n=1 Tax=Formosa sp. Hel1_31_208 TaxID=1798225 RepID=UPI00087C9549|nr:rRNA maturation RNase YbeY [Formosa sp. Hel1_31_208]SDR74283.1 rRNA maturation RNase YbeY [Formosa sp. Hel1_31_208]
MISFNYEGDFKLENEQAVSQWVSATILNEGYNEGEINYIFCDDDYLHKINVKYLDHDTLTDIISFDYSVGKELHGDIYISTERVTENAKDFRVEFSEELHRVIIHGILHYCGYKDKTDQESKEMRSLENHYLTKR